MIFYKLFTSPCIHRKYLYRSNMLQILPSMIRLQMTPLSWAAWLNYFVDFQDASWVETAIFELVFFPLYHNEVHFLAITSNILTRFTHF